MGLTGFAGSPTYSDARHGDDTHGDDGHGDDAHQGEGDHEPEPADDGSHVPPSHASDPGAATAPEDPPEEEQGSVYYRSASGKHFLLQFKGN